VEYPDAVIRRVAEQALLEWDLDVAELALVSRRENVVFRVVAKSGESYALRVHRPGYHTLAELESEPLWTAALNAVGVGAPVAEKTRAGEHYAVVGVPGTDEVRHVGVIPWFEGVPLRELNEQSADAGGRTAHFEQLGRLMATMHNQATDWQPPRQFERHSLDADGLMGEAPFWGRFWEISELTPAQRELLARARRVLHARLSEYGKSRGTYSMIHADLHPGNVLVAGERLHVIDFDDAGFGWHQYDMAVALFDDMLHPDYDAIRDALIAGYRSQRALSDEAVALLPQFLLVRMLAGLGWLHDRPEVELYQLMPVLIELGCSRAEALLAQAPA
jgi:Ser/Thr protein kinase RdoA (MazF antagonist)